ncbi:hypothetical protein BYT27DRAFT_7260554 [Phlegmacium glaucopus]|nr:hypothetical protein BYT27DRAFT_7260554 [Phlegmacium glaucopus]
MPSQSKTNTKTLYTPVFFSSSSEQPPRGSRSTNSANLKVPSAYLNALSRTHIALAQIVQEVPSSRPGSPTEDADGSYPDLSTKERISALRARVKEAWTMAEGNPADGKWTLLTHLLRMSVTSGKAGRWAGTRADLKAPDAPEGGWINAVTEAEWAEWEKRVGLKDKVENWRVRLETHEDLATQVIKDTQNTVYVESSSKSERQEEVKTTDKKTERRAVQDIGLVDQVASSSAAKTTDSTSIPKAQVIRATSESAVTTNPNPLKDNSLFGFAVVKRSNPSVAAVGKKPHVDSNPANRLANDTATAPAIRKIDDIPETASP